MEYLAKCDDEDKNRHVATTVVQAGESKITDMASAISTTTAEWVEATAIREKESTVFVASEEALVATVDTVGRAINIIEKEMEKNVASFTQVASLDFVSVMKSLSTMVYTAGFSQSDLHQLATLFQSQQSFPHDFCEFGAPAAAAYEALVELKEKMDTELADMRQAECDATHNFEMKIQSLSDQLMAEKKDLAGREN